MAAEALAGAADAALQESEHVVRVPANMMRLLRESYDTRQKQLDWWLALAVAGALCWAFRDQLMGIVGLSDATANAGAYPHMKPNQDIGQAFPTPSGATGAGRGTVWNGYTYNLPPSRQLKEARGPSATRQPWSPSLAPSFPTIPPIANSGSGA